MGLCMLAGDLAVAKPSLIGALNGDENYLVVSLTKFKQ
jgi:hypothetical protein